MAGKGDGWYVVDGTGKTRGPLDENKLAGLYKAKHIHQNTYIWNGTSVKEWKPISAVKPLYNKLEKNASTITDPTKSKVVMKAVRKGERKGLLGNIRNGLKLRKTKPTEEPPKRLQDDFQPPQEEPNEEPAAPAPAPGPSTGAGGGPGNGYGQQQPYNGNQSNNDDKMMELLKMMALMQGMRNMPGDPDLVDKAAAIVKPDYKPPQERQIKPKRKNFIEPEPSQNLIEEFKARRKQILDNDKKRLKKKWEPTPLTKEASEKAQKIKERNKRKDRIISGRGYKTSSIFKSHQSSAMAWKVEKIKNMLDGLEDSDFELLAKIESLIKNGTLDDQTSNEKKTKNEDEIEKPKDTTKQENNEQDDPWG